MSVRAIITEGFGSFGTVPDVIRMGFGATAEPEPQPEQRIVLVGGGADFTSWEDHVKALHEKRQLENQLKQYKTQVRKVERKIRKVTKELEKPEHPKGILANLNLLEERKNELEAKIRVVHDKLITLDWLIEAVKTEEDDEEVLLLTQ